MFLDLLHNCYLLPAEVKYNDDEGVVKNSPTNSNNNEEKEGLELQLLLPNSTDVAGASAAAAALLDEMEMGDNNQLKYTAVDSFED